MKGFDVRRLVVATWAAAVVLAECGALQPPIFASGKHVVTAAGDAKYKILYSFDGAYGVGGPNGGPPLFAPVLDANGNLYGPAGGGTGNAIDCNGPCGVIYKVSRGSGGDWSESVVLNVSDFFNDAAPGSPVSFDEHGNMYGNLGLGSIGSHWVYRYAPRSAGGFQIIYQSYSGGTGGVVSDGQGDLFGYLGQGVDYCGSVGELAPLSGGWIFNDLHDLCGGNGSIPDGSDPRAPFSWDAKGNLYGTDYSGSLQCPGGLGCGVAFQLTPRKDGTWTYHILHQFEGPPKDGMQPWGGLLVDGSGTVYGTAISGGPNGDGEIFALTQSRDGAWQETRLYDFPDIRLGGYPWGTLVSDSSGNLYGVGNGGNTCGPYYCGEVFELTKGAGRRWQYHVLHSFAGSDGAYPYGGVVIDKHGRLFGTALGGGAYNYGVVFEISP
jgi:hypothetical protein